MTRGLLRYRYLLLAVYAAALAVPVCLHHLNTLNDYDLDVYGGRALLGSMPHYHSGALHLYASVPLLQIGPLVLLLAGALETVWSPGAQPIWMALVMVCALVTAFAVERVAVTVGWRRPQLVGVAAGVVLMPVFVSIERYGHLEDAVTVAGIAVAAALIAERRPWWLPAVVLGLAVSTKPWGAAALPLLFASPGRWKAVTVGVVAAVLPWLPFVVAAPHTISALGSLPNAIYRGSALTAFGLPVGSAAPHALRSMEIGLALILAVLAAARGRWLAVPLAMMAGRMLLEPRFQAYYLLGAVFAAVLWDVARRARWPWWTVASVVIFGSALWALVLVPVEQLVFGVAAVLLVASPRLRVSGRDDAALPELGEAQTGRLAVAGGQAM